MPQRPYLFHGTAENIRLARPAHPWQTWCGRRNRRRCLHRRAAPGLRHRARERGARLSGGQAQRIALARAFLKDAPLLLLDEPTSGLDLDTEALLQDALAALLQGRTALIVAHRLSTIRRADQIIVLDAGRVVEAGTHTALVAAGGMYARLVRAYGSPEQPVLMDE